MKRVKREACVECIGRQKERSEESKETESCKKKCIGSQKERSGESIERVV